MMYVELFCGRKGGSNPALARGHERWTTDINPEFAPTVAADILKLDPDVLPKKPDVVWASPPCEAFSTLQIGANWTREHEPKTDAARLGLAILERTLELIDYWQPKFWILENPTAKMRRMPCLANRTRYLHPDVKSKDAPSVTYCRYGEPVRKPTDFWGVFPDGFELVKPCAPYHKGDPTVMGPDGRRWVRGPDGGPCHVYSPRGGNEGTQGPKPRGLTNHKRLHRGLYATSSNLAAMRSEIPWKLALTWTLACEKALGDPRADLPPQWEKPNQQAALGLFPATEGA